MKLCQKQGNGICINCDRYAGPNIVCRYDAEAHLDLLLAILNTQLTREQLSIIEDFQTDELNGGRDKMTKHRLKLDSRYYEDSASGIKTFEIRKNDRNFQVGDVLELREWVYSNLQKQGAYTGEAHWKIITYILDDAEYLKDGYVCLGVSPIAEPEEETHD